MSLTKSIAAVVEGSPYDPAHRVQNREMRVLLQEIFAEIVALSQGTNRLASAALATTGNVTLSGEQSIDGTLTSTSRVLVRAQTDTGENGVWITGPGAWARAADADSDAEIAHAYVFVTGGSTLAGTAWQVTGAPELGVDDVDLAQVDLTADLAAHLALPNPHNTSMDDIGEGVDYHRLTTAMKAVIEHLTVTGAVDLDALVTSLDSVTSELAGKADTSALSALAALVADKADASALTALAGEVDGKADGSALAALADEVGAIDAETVGLENVDNTPDAEKPVSAAQRTAIDRSVTVQAMRAEMVEAWSNALTGEPEARNALVIGAPAVSTLLGAVRRVTGAQTSPSAVVARRAAYEIAAGRTYRVRGTLARHVDPADPAGHAVQLRVQWLNESKASISGATIAEIVPTVADGAQQIEATLSREAGADLQAPPTARYATIYWRIYGGDHETDLGALDLVDVSHVAATVAPAFERANHEGEQAISTVTGLQEDLDKRDLKAIVAVFEAGGVVAVDTTANKIAFPDLRVHPFGGSAVVIAATADLALGEGNARYYYYADLNAASPTYLKVVRTETVADAYSAADRIYLGMSAFSKLAQNQHGLPVSYTVEEAAAATLLATKVGAPGVDARALAHVASQISGRNHYWSTGISVPADGTFVPVAEAFGEYPVNCDAGAKVTLEHLFGGESHIPIAGNGVTIYAGRGQTFAGRTENTLTIGGRGCVSISKVGTNTSNSLYVTPADTPGATYTYSTEPPPTPALSLGLFGQSHWVRNFYEGLGGFHRGLRDVDWSFSTPGDYAIEEILHVEAANGGTGIFSVAGGNAGYWDFELDQPTALLLAEVETANNAVAANPANPAITYVFGGNGAADVNQVHLGIYGEADLRLGFQKVYGYFRDNATNAAKFLMQVTGLQDGDIDPRNNALSAVRSATIWARDNYTWMYPAAPIYDLMGGRGNIHRFGKDYYTLMYRNARFFNNVRRGQACNLGPKISAAKYGPGGSYVDVYFEVGAGRKLNPPGGNISVTEAMGPHPWGFGVIASNSSVGGAANAMDHMLAITKGEIRTDGTYSLGVSFHIRLYLAASAQTKAQGGTVLYPCGAFWEAATGGVVRDDLQHLDMFGMPLREAREPVDEAAF